MRNIYSSLTNINKGSRMASGVLFVVFALAVLWCSFTASSLHLGLSSADQLSGGVVSLNSFDPLKEVVVMNGMTIILILVVVMTVVTLAVLANTKRNDSISDVRLVLLEQYLAQLYNPILQAFRRGILHPQIY